MGRDELVLDEKNQCLRKTYTKDLKENGGIKIRSLKNTYISLLDFKSLLII